jgi:uncharacterized protein
MSVFTVIKRDVAGTETLRYTGELVERGAAWVCIRAPFSFSDRDLGYVVLRRGDIFTEWFYSDKWYNIFRIEDVDSGQLKGWYCNLTRPAEIQADTVAADDLALDVFVKPDGTWLLLDEDEYQALAIAPAEDAHVQAAITEITRLVAHRQPPFIF